MMLVHIVENKEDGAGLDLADLVTKKVIKVRERAPVVLTLRGCYCIWVRLPLNAAELLHVP
jgi:hypothetical protein